MDFSEDPWLEKITLHTMCFLLGKVSITPVLSHFYVPSEALFDEALDLWFIIPGGFASECYRVSIPLHRILPTSPLFTNNLY